MEKAAGLLAAVILGTIFMLVLQALIEFGVDRPSATKHVNRVLARFPGCVHHSIIAVEAFDDFRQSQITAECSSTKSRALPNGYSDNLANGFIGL